MTCPVWLCVLALRFCSLIACLGTWKPVWVWNQSHFRPRGNWTDLWKRNVKMDRQIAHVNGPLKIRIKLFLVQIKIRDFSSLLISMSKRNKMKELLSICHSVYFQSILWSSLGNCDINYFILRNHFHISRPKFPKFERD